MAIRIGSSCCGRYSRTISGITCAEVRILQNEEHQHAWEDAEFCIKNNIFLIVNIDSYLTNSRWHPTNQQLRDFVLSVKSQLKSIGANKYNTRFTTDNEADEWDNFSSYYNRVRVIHDNLANEFDLGAGNFRTPKKNWYESLAMLYSQGDYEVFDFHMQDGLNDATDISSYLTYSQRLKPVGVCQVQLLALFLRPALSIQDFP